MGVPKFYRWISERYPCLSSAVKEYQIPEFDNLYLDMNGIIHVCSHPNDDDPHFRITEERIFLDIFNYIDFLFRMIKPKKTFFMAVDGVAPRAKMNQQRGRRFKSAKEAQAQEKEARERGEVLPTEERFDSNCISPGTEFMARLQDQLQQFVAVKVSSDPLWRGVKVYLSGHQTPGEGEHKVMDFIRTERSQPGYDPDTRHCLYGLDADLIMLGMCSHEPHFALLREEIVYGKGKHLKRLNVPEEITFHLLHLSLLREYLELEFQELKKTISFEFKMDNIIDDWVLMCFLVGNDFLPHLPNLHIAHNALPVLYQAYIDVMPSLGGYINEYGKLNLERFEKFLTRLSQFDYEKFSDVQADQKFLASKRAYAEAPNGIVQQNGSPPSGKEKTKDPDEKRLLEKFSHLDIPDFDSDEDQEGLLEMEFRQHKRDYYVNKLEYSDVNKQVMQEQAHGYVRAIQWNLHYYYNGVQSWNWFYPHHYSPYISDIKDFQNLDMTFELSKPFLPFQQLMAILPSASKKLVPVAYQDLMENEASPILDYYPKDFNTDLNGKQHDWEAVVLIPFIEEDRLLPAMEERFEKLTEEEKSRNGHSGHLLFVYSEEPQPPRPCKGERLVPSLEVNHAKVTELDMNVFRLPVSKIKKGLMEGIRLDVYFPGFPTLKHLDYTGCLKKESIKVFQALTRNESMVITINNKDERTLKEISTELLGKSVYVYWPHLLEALVVAVSTRDERHSLEIHKHAKSCESVSIYKLASTDQEVFDMQVSGIKDRYLSRYGVNVGEVDILVFCKTLTGRKYTCTSRGRVTLDKQWAELSVPFALQSIVKDITEKSPDFEEFKTIEELFPVGKTCFMIGSPHYGCSGTVVDAKPENRAGRIMIKFKVPSEPNLDGIIRNERNLCQVHYMNAHQMSQQLGVNAQFVSRITGTVYIQMNSREAEAASLVNVGLHLKFNKTSEEIPGYSKRTNDAWLYSTKCLQVLKEYLAKYLGFVQRIIPFLGQDKIAVEDLYPKGVGKEEVKEVAKWIKEQDCTKVARVKSGAQLLDEGVVHAIEETVKRAKSTQPPQEVLLDVHPKHLYRPGLQFGWVPPDPKATYSLFDRVVNVRENIAVPLGYRGTIIGLLPLEDNDPQMCEVVFDEPFAGGLPLRCSEHRGYRISILFLVNLSYGSRIQRSQQLYQVPARRQQLADSYPAVAGNKVRTGGSAQPRATHASAGNGWQDLSPQRRQEKNRFHHSPNSPFEAQKSSPAPESPSQGTSDFASLWLGLQKTTTAPMPCSVPTAQQASTSSRHQGTPLSLDELFKGAKNYEGQTSGAVAVSSASILEDLVKRTKETMGAEPEHFCIGIDGQKKMPASQPVQPTPIAVQAQRPNVPLSFGNPPQACASSLGTQFRMPPPCEASLIPDSFVESNRRLMETLNCMPSEQQLGPSLSWQTPRMPLPFNRAPVYMATSAGKEPYQQRPFFPSPRNTFAPRPAMYMAGPPHHLQYPQQQQQLHRQPHPDSLLRPQFPARSPQKDRQPVHRGGGRYGEQQSEPCLQRPPPFPEHKLSASANIFIPTQVMRRLPSKSSAATSSSSSLRKNKAAASSTTKSPPTKEASVQKPLDVIASAPPAKQETAKGSGATNTTAPLSAAQSSIAEPSPVSNAPKPASQDAASSNSKPPARRSRLAVKFDFAPS
ncbi:5'-3' exoribonuclease pacman isoform X2 [Rhipicephalus microplus]|uniref:5'-3' exoribonuclease pacman isoform X2 n=1 Tax=Rhipicephalus microplus TaxID=6941 RepID=UPI003F6B2F32